MPAHRAERRLRRPVCLAAALLLAACSAPGTGSSLPTRVVTASRTASPLGADDWPTYHRNALRTGVAPGAAPVGPPRTAWTVRLDGAVYGQPLVVGGRVLAATENATLYGLDAASGRVLWSRHVGDPARAGELPCGNIDPLGITGTPVYDPDTGLVFAVAELTGGRHVLVGLDAATGALVVQREAEPPKGTGSPTSSGPRSRCGTAGC
ncbi:PQQ-binding-like beta-propeller repeat protein [Kitasatospora paranensis]|uniref:outer membrane protein assembly factor BamB family protein n=1 Tax=Kitasatospora paranensis TaxID=258053 RepID=UPI0031E54FB1